MTPTTLTKYPLIVLLFLFVFSLGSYAQAPKHYNASDILIRLEKLKVLGSVLYVAAHPDDENTSVIAYYANGALTRTGYLSATRGDGGQNLIGPEIRESLGIIRTQELLAARRIDHGEQFFSRAVDFGYSKHPDETFSKWDKEKVLSDFVKVYRQFKPDVVITRFSTQPGVTHGHHTASAILAIEAFKQSADPNAFSDQLEALTTWQPKRILWNTSYFFYQNSSQGFDTTNLARVNVGAYSPMIGESYTEISAQSRSMHKSQGFGRSSSRGDQYDYFVSHDKSVVPADIFEGIDTSWKRVAGSEKVIYFIQEAIANFDPSKPYLILEDLVSARKSLMVLPDQYWKNVKLKELDELILAVTGTFIELVTDQETFAVGDSLVIKGELTNRSPGDILLSSIDFNINEETFLFNLDLTENKANHLNFELSIPKDFPISQPYWLRAEGTDGTFRVDDPSMIGKPENDPPISARVTLNVADQFIDYEIPVLFNSSDPVAGEEYKPVHITPPVMVSVDQDVLTFGDNAAKNVAVKVLAGKKNVKGEVYLDLPNGWKSNPERSTFDLTSKGEEKTFVFAVYPSREQGQFEITATASLGDNVYQRGIQEITYDHISPQILFPKTIIKASRIDLKIADGRIGYIMGAGDIIPQSLEQIGYTVDMLKETDVVTGNLGKYKSIILGVRAFNTIDWLAAKNTVLFDYVKEGGNLIVQYNTNSRLVTRKIAPFPLDLSRDRVTVEESEVRFLDPKHIILNFPNKITSADFEGWVQERGLYFPRSWSTDFEAVVSMNDPGEEPLDGSLLVAKYGSGYYIYTGLSFFRELPAGVPGAYRLFTNLISIGNKKEQ
ncbi:MAG: PIG-L family deacetylase [Bacteroidota bacterium]